MSTRVMGTYGYAAPEYVMTGEFGYKYHLAGYLFCIDIVTLSTTISCC